MSKYNVVRRYLGEKSILHGPTPIKEAIEAWRGAATPSLMTSHEPSYCWTDNWGHYIYIEREDNLQSPMVRPVHHLEIEGELMYTYAESVKIAEALIQAGVTATCDAQPQSGCFVIEILVGQYNLAVHRLNEMNLKIVDEARTIGGKVTLVVEATATVAPE